MFVSFHKFLPFYILFLLIGTSDRIVSTFLGKKLTSDKSIRYDWAFPLSLYLYLFIVGMSVAEFFLKVKHINLIFSLFGVISFLGGAILRKKAISTLGDNWSLYTGIKKEHKLITSGIYYHLKHPYYLAVILELAGACLVANAFYSLTLVFLIQCPLLLVRIDLEEKILINYFGDEYKNYKKGKFL